MFHSGPARLLVAVAAALGSTILAAAAVQADAPRSFSVTPSHGSANTGVTASFTFTVSASDPCQGQQIDFTWDGAPWASVARPTYIAGNGRCTGSITQPAPACFGGSGQHTLAAKGSLGNDSGTGSFTIDPSAGSPPCPKPTPTPASTPPPSATAKPTATPSSAAQPTTGPSAPSPSPSAGPSATASPAATPSAPTPTPVRSSSRPCPTPPATCNSPAAAPPPVHPPPSAPGPRAAVFGATAGLLLFGGGTLLVSARRARRPVVLRAS